MSVDENQPARPARGRPAELDQQQPQCGGADRNGAGKALVFATGSVADRRGKHPSGIMIGLCQPFSNPPSDGSGDPGVGVERQVRSMLFGGTYRDNQRG